MRLWEASVPTTGLAKLLSFPSLPQDCKAPCVLSLCSAQSWVGCAAVVVLPSKAVAVCYLWPVLQSSWRAAVQSGC